MPFEEPELYLQHIVTAITSVEEFTAGMDFSAYQTDLKTRSATERQIAILSEAASRLGDKATVLVSAIDWRSIRGMGNRLRHGYDRINDEVIWRTIHFDLPPLKAAVHEALLRMADERHKTK